MLVLHAPEVGAIARVVGRDGAGPSIVGLQLELGMIAPVLVLRDETDSGAVPYARAELVVRAGNAPVAVDLRIGWTYAAWDEAIGGTGMPLGGVSFAVGATW
jgi:hypothetical protein